MTDKTDRARFDGMAARAEILIPTIKRMLDEINSTHEEVAATLRVHADLVEGRTDPAEDAGSRRLAEEVAKAFAEEGVPVRYHHH